MKHALSPEHASMIFFVQYQSSHGTHLSCIQFQITQNASSMGLTFSSEILTQKSKQFTSWESPKVCYLVPISIYIKTFQSEIQCRHRIELENHMLPIPITDLRRKQLLTSFIGSSGSQFIIIT